MHIEFKKNSGDPFEIISGVPLKNSYTAEIAIPTPHRTQRIVTRINETAMMTKAEKPLPTTTVIELAAIAFPLLISGEFGGISVSISFAICPLLMSRNRTYQGIVLLGIESNARHN